MKQVEIQHCGSGIIPALISKRAPASSRSAGTKPRSEANQTVKTLNAGKTAGRTFVVGPVRPEAPVFFLFYTHVDGRIGNRRKVPGIHDWHTCF